MYSAFAKDIALLQRRLTGMKKRASYLFSEAQHHQLQMLEQSFSKKVLSNNKRNNLNDVYLDIMSRKVETQQMVTQSGVTKLKIEVSHAAGFTDELQLSPIPSRRKRRKMEHEIDLEDQVTREKGVFRLFQVEGTTGDAAYASSVMVRRNVGQSCGKAMSLINLRIGTQSSIPKQMLTPVRLNVPETVYCFTNDLYYYKMLLEERQEALDQMESDVPGLEEIEHSEPVVLRLLCQGQHEVEVIWGLQWDELNCIFKYNISLNCAEEVATRYSRSNLYRYLSGQRKLKTQEEVISFAEMFSDL